MIRRIRLFVRSRPLLRSAILRVIGPAIPVVMRWYQRHERVYYPSWLKARAARVGMELALVPADCPLLFIVLPSGAPLARRRTLAALRRQSDPGWRLLDIDGSAASIAASKRQAASLGGWWMLLRPGDIPSPQAVVQLRLAAGEAVVEVVYADEDQAMGFGWRWRPWFKPGFDADLLLVQNSFGSAVAYRATSLPADGKTGHALALDRSSRWLRGGTAPVRHIADVLLSRPPGRRAPWRRGVDRAAVLAALATDGRGAQLATTAAGLPRIDWPLPDPAPLVSIIIPTRDRLDLLIPCVESLLSRTNYPALEIIIADNDSREATTLALFTAWRDEPRLRVLPCPGMFNYSRINNQAARAARGDILLLLNNDTEVLEPGWLRAMVALVMRPEIGAVGARLLYPDGRVQHAGVVLGLGGVAGHDLAFSPGDDPGPEDILCHTRTVSAATAACLAIRREVFAAVGGFDEEALQVAYNDVDLCLRIRQAGYRNLVTPQACLLHKESASRGNDMAPEHRLRWERECRVMQARWGALLQHDPYYNASLAMEGTARGLAWPARPGSAAPGLASTGLAPGLSDPP